MELRYSEIKYRRLIAPEQVFLNPGMKNKLNC